jgi:serine/threonine protein kinase
VLHLPDDGEYDSSSMHIKDFGIYFLTQLVGPAGRPYLVPGCIEYMAPELRSLRRIDPNPMSDMWAVGAMGYEMAMGQEMNSTSAMFRPIESYYQGAPQLDISQIPGRFSRYIGEIIRKCMHRDPDQRYTAQQLQSYINQFLTLSPVVRPTTFMSSPGWT